MHLRMQCLSRVQYCATSDFGNKHTLKYCCFACLRTQVNLLQRCFSEVAELQGPPVPLTSS